MPMLGLETMSPNSEKTNGLGLRSFAVQTHFGVSCFWRRSSANTMSLTKAELPMFLLHMHVASHNLSIRECAMC